MKKNLLILFFSEQFANVFLLCDFSYNIQWPNVSMKLKVFLTFPAARIHWLPPAVYLHRECFKASSSQRRV